MPAYLVAGYVDGSNPLEPEVPLQLRNREGGYKTAARSIDVDRDLELPLDEQIVNSLAVFIVSRISRSENDADTDCVFVAEVNGLLGVNNKSGRCAEDEFLLNLKVPGGLFPADLDGRGHDEIGILGGLALGLAACLPASLHGENGKHDGL